MKKLSLIVAGGIFIASLFLLGGCKLNNTGPSFSQFSIPIDSIQTIPDTITLGNTFKIKFYGKIGPSTCYSFYRFGGRINGKDIDIAVYGKYQNDPSCQDTAQYLDGKELSVTPQISGTYAIHIYQPSPPDLFDTVYVATAPAQTKVAH